MLKSLDIFFILFHSILIVFNLLGWIWKPTRKANLVTLLLTGSSWFILGIFYGIGYCPLTDWHWEILRKLGTENIPNSYIQYLIIRIFHIEIDAKIVDIITASGYFCFNCTIIFNFRKPAQSYYKKAVFYLNLIFTIACVKKI